MLRADEIGMVDEKFFFPRKAVSIIAVGDTGEALLLRAILESLGTAVRLHLPGTPEDILACLNQPDNPPPYLIISGHGDQNGLVIGDINPDVTQLKLREGSLPVEAILGKVHLSGTVIFSTACCTGYDAFGKAFIEGGAKAYIASAGYPDGAATPLFVHMLFYELLVGKSSLEDALSRAATIDDDGDLAFALFKQ